MAEVLKFRDHGASSVCRISSEGSDETVGEVEMREEAHISSDLLLALLLLSLVFFRGPPNRQFVIRILDKRFYPTPSINIARNATGNCREPKPTTSETQQ